MGNCFDYDSSFPSLPLSPLLKSEAVNPFITSFLLSTYYCTNSLSKGINRTRGLPQCGSVVKTCLECRRHMRRRFDPWVGKIPRRRQWQLTPVFLSGKSHGQRRLVDYGPWGHKQLDMTEHTHTHTQTEQNYK